MRTNLFGMERDALASVLAEYDAPAFHAGQAYRWMYARRRYRPAGWTDLSKALRERLAQEVRVDHGAIEDRVRAADGTTKYRIRLAQGGRVESVFMRDDERVTLCLSSQVGCALACDFCLTGAMGFGRNLSAGEIVGQVASIQDDTGLEAPFNVVFMGMGEPLHNYDAVVSALRILTDPEGFGLSRRRITVSTVGLVPQIEKLATESVRPRLAVSLNATTNDQRDRLMPVNKKWNIERLLAACRTYAGSTGSRTTLEYVLLDGVNDGDDDIRRLSRHARSLPAQVNLIPHNPVPGWLQYGPPNRATIERFRKELVASGTRASVRWSRGIEARAACGQLALLPDRPAVNA